MIKIYGSMRSRANRCVWAAEEAGVPFELAPIDFAKNEQKGPEYLKINPNARVPALQDGDLTLWESFAINLYLAKKSGGDLGPKSAAEDALMTMWSMWATNEMEKYGLDVLFHTAFLPEDKRDPKVVEAALVALERPLAVLDAALAKGPLVGGRFTIADLNVGCILIYLRGKSDYLAKFPRVAAALKAATERPGFQRAFARR